MIEVPFGILVVWINDLLNWAYYACFRYVLRLDCMCKLLEGVCLILVKEMV